MIGIDGKSLFVERKVLFYIVLFAISLVIIIPLYLLLLNSLKNSVKASVIDLKLPEKFLFSNYRDVLIRGNVFRAILNGILITISAVAVNIIVSSMASFILIRRNSKFNVFLYSFFIIGLAAPLAIIPEIKVLQFLGIMGSYLGIICIHIAVNIPLSIMLYSGFIKGIPRQLDESAIVDGCKPLRLFFQVIFPLLRPVTFTSMVILFMAVWNDFQFSLYFLSKASKFTMPLTVYNFIGFHTAEMNLICADMVLTALPVILVYLFAQKYIIAGMVTGAVKG